jgi:hypothetical protein
MHDNRLVVHVTLCFIIIIIIIVVVVDIIIIKKKLCGVFTVNKTKLCGFLLYICALLEFSQFTISFKY